MEKKVFHKIIWKVLECSKETFMVEASPSFNVKFGDIDTTWCMLFYTNGEDSDSKSHISLFLELVESSSKSFEVAFTMSIKSRYSEDNLTLTAGVKKGEDFTARRWSEFITHKELFDPVNGFIAADESITIICELTISKPKSESAFFVYKSSSFASVFQDDDLADFELKMSDGKVLKAHKLVLSLQSKVFKAMLKNDTKEAQEGSVTIPDFDSKTMREVLRFMYTYEVENLNKLDRDLVFAAEKYELDELKEICIENIIKRLTTENVLEAMVMSQRLSNAEELFEECAEFIINHYEAVSSQKDEWKELPMDCIMKFNEKIMKEMDRNRVIKI